MFLNMLKLNKSSTYVMRSRKRKLFLFISLAAISTYMYWMMLDLDVPHVIVCRETHETNASFSTNLKHVHGRPSSLCDNILGNLTNGRWVVTAPGQTAYYDDLLLRYWQKRGILEKLWRNDGKCGYQNLLPRPSGSSWPRVGSWCNTNDGKPCCNDMWNGKCVPAKTSVCQCKNCVNMLLYKHAEASRWVTNDPRCSWTNHTGTSACDVIEKSPFNEIYFIGDSLIRNMFATLLMLLSDDPVHGAWSRLMMPEWMKICKSDTFYFWDECRKLVGDMDDVFFPSNLCGGRKPNFTASFKMFYSVSESRAFRKFMRTIAGKPRTLVLIGVGAHMVYDPDVVIKKYLHPAVQQLNAYNVACSIETTWPKLMFVHPMRGSLLKPPVYFKYQDNRKLSHFISRINEYCSAMGIPVFDFRQLGYFVHSFDGTHYGRGVNLMKNQVFLNYLSRL